MSRESGYYWVRRDNSEWEPAEWCAEYSLWLVLGCDGDFGIYDRHLTEIGPRIIPPDEKGEVS